MPLLNYSPLANVTCAQVLILLPFRNAALGVVLRLAALAQAETRTDSVQHKERFVREFGDEDGEPPHVRLSTCRPCQCALRPKQGHHLPLAGHLTVAPSPAAATRQMPTDGWVCTGGERCGA